MLWRVISKLRLEASMAASPLFGLVTSVILAQALGTARRGQLTALTVWAQAATLVIFLSLDKGLLALTSRAHGESRSALAVNLERAGRAPAWALSVLSGLAAALMLVHIQVNPMLVVVGAMASVALCRYEWVAGYAMAGDKWNAYMLTRIVQPAAYMVLCVLTFLILHGPDQRFIGFGLSFLGATIISCVILGSIIPRRSPTLDPGDLRAHRSIIFRYSLRYHLTTLGSFAAGRIDILMVTSLLTFSQAGVYAVAGAPASLMAGLGSAALLKSLGGFALRNRQERYAEAALLVGASVALAMMCPILIPLAFGKEFEEAVPVAQVLIGGALLQYYTQSILGALARAGNPWRAGVPNVACTGVIALSFIVTSTPLGVGVAVLAARGVAMLCGMFLLTGTSVKEGG